MLNTFMFFVGRGVVSHKGGSDPSQNFCQKVIGENPKKVQIFRNPRIDRFLGQELMNCK